MAHPGSGQTTGQISSTVKSPVASIAIKKGENAAFSNSVTWLRDNLEFTAFLS